MSLVTHDMLVPSQDRYTFPGENPRLGITVHETANTSAGADAAAHARLQYKGNTRPGSWHWTVDDTEAYRSYLETKRCWHAGDGKGDGNMSTIAIEICVNSDGDWERAVANAAELVAKLMRENSIPLSRVKQHHDYSSYGKNCPTRLRQALGGISWTHFLVMVKNAYDGASPVVKPVTPPVVDDELLDVDGWWGTSTTADLQRAMGTTVDGKVSSQNIGWRDDNPGLTSGWMWTDPTEAVGSQLMRAMQEWLGADYDGKKDGLIGPLMIKGLQRRLKRMGYYTGAIDGELWRQSSTIKALQRALNDGKIRK